MTSSDLKEAHRACFPFFLLPPPSLVLLIPCSLHIYRIPLPDIDRLGLSIRAVYRESFSLTPQAPDFLRRP